jgi:WD40 repeat protein
VARSRRRGEHTFRTFGFPDAKPVEGMPGKCEVIGRTTERGFPVLQLRSSEVTRGFSGAPVWDATLDVVIGMVASIIRQDPYGKLVETAFIIPVETLRKVCFNLRLPYRCPYRGLQVFESEHADDYLGREDATRELLEMLNQRDFVAVIGVSGSGKSSLVRAGLAKGLRMWSIPGLVNRPHCLFTPGDAPLLNLVLALAGLPKQKTTRLAQSFKVQTHALMKEGKARRHANEVLNTRSPKTLAKALRTYFRSSGLLLIVDQFERLYTECQDEAVRTRFIDTLLTAASDTVKVLIALRADFYGRALAHTALAEAIKDSQITLLPMNETEIRRAIVEPARTLHRTFQPGLVERIVTDVRGQAGHLPLLEFALTELWERDAKKGVLTLASYESLGYDGPDGKHYPGLQGAIAHRAEEIWQRLSKADRESARRVFLRLVTPGVEDGRGQMVAEDTSRRAWQTEWDEPTRRMVQELVQARLLTTGQDPVSGQPTVEVAHEALIRAWPRLGRWVADYRPFAHWYANELMPFLRRWLGKGQQPDFLLPDAMLLQAQHWLAEYPGELSGPPEEYIRASMEKREEEQRARERLRRWITFGATVAAVVLAIVAGMARFQWKQAEKQRQAALARQLIAQAELFRVDEEDSWTVAGLLAAEAARRQPDTAEVRAVVRRLLEHLGHPVARLSHDDGVVSAIFTPDGQRVTTASNDGRVRIWEAETGQEITRLEQEVDAESVVLSPDGQWAAIVGEYDTVRVWDVTTVRKVAQLECERSVGSLVFSSDGQEVMALNGNTVQIWEVSTGEEIAQLKHPYKVESAVLSPDGQWVAVVGEDDTVQVWDVTKSREVAQLECGERGVGSLVFSPDGQWLAEEGGYSTVRIWEAFTGHEVAKMEHTYWVGSVVFSPDGQWVATAGGDNTARVWEVATWREVTRLEHEWCVRWAAFSPDGQRLVTCDCADSVRLWDAANGQAVAQLGYVHSRNPNSVTFSANGQWLAKRGYSTVRIWEAFTGREVARLEHANEVISVKFSPGAQYVVTVSTDGVARVWEAATGKTIITLKHDWHVDTVVFSPDGRWVATPDGYTVRVFEATTGKKVAQLSSGMIANRGALFSPDGRWIATDGCQEVYVYEANTLEEVAELDHSGVQPFGTCLHSIVFSPNGQWIATAQQNVLRVWDTTNWEQVAWLEHDRRVNSVAFSLKARWMASASSGDIAYGCMEGEPCPTRIPNPPGGAVRVWEVGLWNECSQVESSDGGRSVVFSPDGRWVATPSNYGVRIWEAARRRKSFV